MVQFFDPIANKEIDFYLPPRLIKYWDKIRDGKLKYKDEDRAFCVDGREGSGKSLWTFQQAKYLDPTFNIDRIAFTPEKFLEILRSCSPGQVVVFDEAFRGLSSKGNQSKVNKAIVEALMEVRQRNLIIFIVLPTFFLLEPYAAVFRTQSLFHIYKTKSEYLPGIKNRYWRCYNYNKKQLLYYVGKKKNLSYAFPKIIKNKGPIRVRQVEINGEKMRTPYETFEILEYKRRKYESFLNKKEEKPEDMVKSKFKKQRDALLRVFYKKDFKKYIDMERFLKEQGIDISEKTIRDAFEAEDDEI